MRSKLIIAAILALAFAGAAAAQDRRDHDVFNDIASQVNRDVHFTVFDDVSASVEQGIVTLEGKVTMPFKRSAIERRVKDVKGVREVQNRIDVLPVSIYDDELRYRIARAIYGNPSFWHYAAMANPPIHIVVERGRVRLTGVVNSRVERMLAHSLATSLGALAVTNDLKTDADLSRASGSARAESRDAIRN